MKFSEKLEIMLNRKNIKRVDFAKKIGVTYRAFAYYMSDTRKPRKNVMERISKELDLSVDFLIDDDKDLELTQEEKFIKSLSDDGKNTGETARFLAQSRGLFAGNSLNDEDKKNLMNCLKEIYEDSRRNGKK